MGAWRVILTDSENPSGVAPVCPQQREAGGHHDETYGSTFDRFDVSGVYDCCPGPHIECGNQHVAEAIANMLTAAEAEECP